jgi:enoyl-CoA hydratase
MACRDGSNVSEASSQRAPAGATQMQTIQLATYDDQIWIVTMNRPDQLNAMNSTMRDELIAAFTAYRDDSNARILILTGAGDRAFCSGADLKEIDAKGRGADSAPSNLPVRNGLPEPNRFIPLSETLDLWKPTIAAVNGLAIAGGFMLAMQCDIRLMADSAKVGIAEVRWNMGGAGWMAPLVRQVGLGNALELALWGDTQMSAQRALEIGWAQRVVPFDELMPTAMSYAQRMLDMAPRSVANTKQMLYRGSMMDPVTAMMLGNWLEQNLLGMSDSAEGIAAFRENRRPRFRNQ